MEYEYARILCTVFVWVFGLFSIFLLYHYFVSFQFCPAAPCARMGTSRRFLRKCGKILCSMAFLIIFPAYATAEFSTSYTNSSCTCKMRCTFDKSPACLRPS